MLDATLNAISPHNTMVSNHIARIICAMTPEVKNLSSERNRSFVYQRMMDLVRLKKTPGVTQWSYGQPLEKQTVDT